MSSRYASFDRHRRRDRINDEIDQLRDDYTVTIPQSDRCIVEDYEYPPNWRPRTAAVMFRVTPYWPQEQPAAYVPTSSHCLTAIEKHRWVATDDVDEFTRWCLHPVPWTPDNDFQTFLDMLHDSFRYPNQPHPWTRTGGDDA